MKKPQKIISTGIAMSALTISANAATTFLGGNLDSDASWSGGARPTPGNVGTLAVDGTIDGASTITGTINHIAGDITTSGNNGFNFIGSGTGVYNLSGGSNSSRFMLANNSEINLTSGFVNLGSGTTTVSFGATNGGTMNVGGDVVISASRGIFTGRIDADANSSFNFANSWTGSFNSAGYDATTWKTELVKTGVFFNGTQLTNTVFDNNFTVSGSSISLTAPVPEPSSTALLGLSGLALILRRRK